MNQSRSSAGCQSDRCILFYDSHSDDRQTDGQDGWHHPESNRGDRHWCSHVTSNCDSWAMDGMRGRRGKYKNLTVFLMPVTDTPAMTPFSTYGLSHHSFMESSFPLMLCCKDTNGPFAALNIVSYKTYKVYIFLSSFLFRSLKEVRRSVALKSVQMA